MTGFSAEDRANVLEAAKKRLVDELERLERDKRLVAERQESNSWAKGAEYASEISELTRRFNLEKHLRSQLAEIEHALHKKEQGTYGLCDDCGQPIDPNRLEALPQANLCLNCKASRTKSASGSVSRERLYA
jgi:RNA polymerase-binding transcription factor DksA